jgi:hypothetical protein
MIAGSPAVAATFPVVPSLIQRLFSRSRFDNRQFWNNRYSTDPELGSGVGSRGELAMRKRALVERTWRRWGRGSILDVGFGDLEVLDLGVFKRYTGVDVSDVAVARAQQRFPQHTFVKADFAGKRDPSLPISGAKVVLCFDVVIHQFDADGYRCMVERIVRLTRRVGLISGYDDPPRKGGPIIAFHEPLSQTLERAGATNITRVMAYRGVHVFRFEPAPRGAR